MTLCVEKVHQLFRLSDSMLLSDVIQNLSQGLGVMNVDRTMITAPAITVLIGLDDGVRVLRVHFHDLPWRLIRLAPLRSIQPLSLK